MAIKRRVAPVRASQILTFPRTDDGAALPVHLRAFDDTVNFDGQQFAPRVDKRHGVGLSRPAYCRTLCMSECNGDYA